MQNKFVLILSLSALLAGLWLFWPEQPKRVITAAQFHPVQVSTPTVAATATATPQQITVTEKIAQPVSASFKLLASAYAQELTLPDYSRVLTVDDTHLLQPNRYIPQQVPLEDGASASIMLPAFRFSYPQEVPVTLLVSGLAVSQVKVQLIDETRGKLMISADMQQGSASWSALLTPQPDWDGPMEVSVSFSANGKQQVLKTGIEYSHPVATITGVADSGSAGSDMLIPVQITAEQAGYYRLRANLFTEQRQPLAVLTGTGKLAKGQGEIVLRVYKAVLQHYSGPYVLGTFVLERRPAHPAELTRYGNSAQAEYSLDYFALSQLSDEPWQPSAEELQRLTFLQQLAGEQ
jgi:hypothetical protein